MGKSDEKAKIKSRPKVPVTGIGDDVPLNTPATSICVQSPKTLKQLGLARCSLFGRIASKKMEVVVNRLYSLEFHRKRMESEQMPNLWEGNNGMMEHIGMDFPMPTDSADVELMCDPELIRSVEENMSILGTDTAINHKSDQHTGVVGHATSCETRCGEEIIKFYDDTFVDKMKLTEKLEIPVPPGKKVREHVEYLTLGGCKFFTVPFEETETHGKTSNDVTACVTSSDFTRHNENKFLDEVVISEVGESAEEELLFWKEVSHIYSTLLETRKEISTESMKNREGKRTMQEASDRVLEMESKIAELRKSFSDQLDKREKYGFGVEISHSLRHSESVGCYHLSDVLNIFDKIDKNFKIQKHTAETSVLWNSRTVQKIGMKRLWKASAKGCVTPKEEHFLWKRLEENGKDMEYTANQCRARHKELKDEDIETFVSSKHNISMLKANKKKLESCYDRLIEDRGECIKSKYSKRKFIKFKAVMKQANLSRIWFLRLLRKCGLIRLLETD